ncbi:Transposase IS4 family protein [Legionella moravica]|uniref:Transposase IS4 family protein n=1 Tax=Legionella moravica TaxID=39962 RepID=A0A378K7E6_9GAMM|nr:Transposase IS4 family protein [Legionella moravica]STX63751.1 Transposase IS4 family protein [Legionella moravica]
MDKDVSESFESYFGGLKKLRIERHKLYSLISTIPKLLDFLDLKGQTVTIDAMSTQKTIAKKTCEKEAGFVLALKGNQGTLNDDVRLFLESKFQKGSSTAIVQHIVVNMLNNAKNFFLSLLRACQLIRNPHPQPFSLKKGRREQLV